MSELFEAYCEDNDDDITASNPLVKPLASSLVSKDKPVQAKSSKAAELSNARKTSTAANSASATATASESQPEASEVNESQLDTSQINESQPEASEVNESQLDESVEQQPVEAEKFQYPGHIPPLK